MQLNLLFSFAVLLTVSLNCFAGDPEEVNEARKNAFLLQLSSEKLEVTTMREFSELVVQASELFGAEQGMELITNKFRKHPSFISWASDFKNFYPVVASDSMSEELMIGIAKNFIPEIMRSDVDAGFNLAVELLKSGENDLAWPVYRSVRDKLLDRPDKLLLLIKKIIPWSDRQVLMAFYNDFSFMAETYKVMLPEIAQTSRDWLGVAIKRYKMNIADPDPRLNLSEQDLRIIRENFGFLCHTHFKGEGKLYFEMVKENSALYSDQSPSSLRDYIRTLGAMDTSSRDEGIKILYNLVMDSQSKPIFEALISGLMPMIFDDKEQVKKLRGFLSYKEQYKLLEHFDCDFPLM